MARPEDREAYENLWLGYTETWGAPDLLSAIAQTYDRLSPQEILCFAGAEEGIYAAMRTILEPDSHAIIVTPAYQSLETVPQSICSVTGVPLDPTRDWALDIDEVISAVRSNTRLIVINFPHNPTGAILDRACFDRLIEVCRERGIYLFSDEAYRPLGPVDAVHLPAAADVYELGLSLGVLSKAYGLPGLRIGWIACQDRELLGRLEKTKHYLSICNSAPSERLALNALKAGDQILDRNRRIVSVNLYLLDEFFAERPDLFEWQRPKGGCDAYPRYLGADGVENFAQDLVERSGILVLPSSIFASSISDVPRDRFRIGSGRIGLERGLARFRKHLKDHVA